MGLPGAWLQGLEAPTAAVWVQEGLPWGSLWPMTLQVIIPHITSPCLAKWLSRLTSVSVALDRDSEDKTPLNGGAYRTQKMVTRLRVGRKTY